MTRNTPPPTPTLSVWKIELERVEGQCDERHTSKSRQLNAVERRQQQLFGDPSTKTPGIIHAMQGDIKDIKKSLSSVVVKQAVLVAILTLLVNAAFLAYKG